MLKERRLWFLNDSLRMVNITGMKELVEGGSLKSLESSKIDFGGLGFAGLVAVSFSIVFSISLTVFAVLVSLTNQSSSTADLSNHSISVGPNIANCIWSREEDNSIGSVCSVHAVNQDDDIYDDDNDDMIEKDL